MKKSHIPVLAAVSLIATQAIAINQVPIEGTPKTPSLQLHIPGAPDASKNIREISFVELNIDVRETTTGLDVEYRTYQPGRPKYEDIRFDFACDPAVQKELDAILNQKRIQAPILIQSENSKVIVRGWDPKKKEMIVGGVGRSASGCRLRLTVSIGELQLDAASGYPVPSTQGRYRVSIIDENGKEEVEYLDDVSGGEEVVSLGERFQTTSPGHKSVGEITLRGAMTATRKSMLAWINDTTSGKDRRVTIAITEITHDGRAGRTLTYFDAFPVRYVFPRMSVTNTTGNVMEEVAIKPIRVELK